MITRLIPLLLVVAAIALFIGYVQPTYSGPVAGLKTEIKNLDAALTAARDFKEKEVELTQARAAIEPGQLARLESFLPDSVDNVQLIVDLNSLAARSGVQLSAFNIAGGAQTATAESALTSGEPLESLELSVSATGTYAAFRTFLKGVETSLRPLDIIELSVRDSETGVYTYDITFRLYWLR